MNRLPNFTSPTNVFLASTSMRQRLTLTVSTLDGTHESPSERCYWITLFNHADHAEQGFIYDLSAECRWSTIPFPCICVGERFVVFHEFSVSTKTVSVGSLCQPYSHYACIRFWHMIDGMEYSCLLVNRPSAILRQ